MTKGRRTKEQKERASYRWESSGIRKRSEGREKKERKEFGYLSVEYVSRDLLKTLIASLVIIVIEIYLARVL